MQFAKWVIGDDKDLRDDLSSVEVFLRSIHTAAKCRFGASSRLKNKSEFSFYTATVLSLGLIFIPLVQVSGVKLYISNEFLTVIQIFLAVSVLVYSVINSKSRYDIRAVHINESGDKIKELARELESALSNITSKATFNYESYIQKYREIGEEIENHTQLDYDLARLNMPRYYAISGFKRLLLQLKCLLKICFSYAVSILILFFEFGVIFMSLGIIPLVECWGK